MEIPPIEDFTDTMLDSYKKIVLYLVYFGLGLSTLLQFLNIGMYVHTFDSLNCI